MNKQIIVITGFMLAGKTTSAKKAAVQCELPCYDLDQLIETQCQKKISEIFAEKGEPHFRTIESHAFAELLKQFDQSNQSAIISAGGGLPLAAGNQALLRHCRVIFLNTDLAIILKRLAGDRTRPLLRNLSEQQTVDLWNFRCEIYQQTADFVVKDETQLLNLIRQLIKAV